MTRAARDPRDANLTLIIYTVAVMWSATLIFTVEPMVGRLLLPRLGSTPAVWNTSLLFFQAALLAGYGYAHLSARRLPPRAQVAIHLAALGGAAFTLPLVLPPAWTPPVDGTPVFWQLAVMAAVVGLPFIVLSANAPLLQHWFSRTGHPLAGNPYMLYRASNLGSAIALISYPLIIEPTLGLRAQGVVWSIGYGILVLSICASATVVIRTRRMAPVAAVATPHRAHNIDAHPESRPIDWPRRLRWMTTAGLPSVWLLAVTAYLSTEVAPIPLLWVVPLGIYLLSFTAAFGTWRRLRQRHLLRIVPFALIPLVGTLELHATGPIAVLALIHLGAFALAATLCHREVAEDRPAAAQLTDFYLCLSLGGVLGGLLGGIVAPLVLSSYAEYPIAIVVFCLLFARRTGSATRSRWLDLGLPLGLGGFTVAIATLTLNRIHDPTAQRALVFALPALAAFGFRRRPARFGLGLGAILFATSLPIASAEAQIYATRDYFGVHRVVLSSDLRRHLLYDGGIVHGAQNLDPAHRDEALTYYTRSGPFGDIMESSPAVHAQRVAVVGLGAGTMACYARPGQNWRFYEIDPAVVRIAEDRANFSFLQDCLDDRQRVILGDARLQLQRTAERSDLLIIDAFGGDAIPTHLLTREAVRIDLGHLSAGGLLVFHISNQHADLTGVVGNLAADAGLCAYQREDGDVSGPHVEPGKFASQWVAAGRSCGDVGDLATRPNWTRLPAFPRQRVWTDDYSAILQVVRWGS